MLSEVDPLTRKKKKKTETISKVKQNPDCDLGFNCQVTEGSCRLLFKIAVYSRREQFLREGLINVNVREFVGSVSYF